VRRNMLYIYIFDVKNPFKKNYVQQKKICKTLTS
jgi:hypothetical protein